MPSQRQKNFFSKFQPLEEPFCNENKEIIEALNQNAILNAILNQNSVSIS